MIDMLKIFRKKIGIIGCGNMGAAIAQRVRGKFRLFVFDKDAARAAGIMGAGVLDSAALAADKSDVIIIAVKPQDIQGALMEIKDKAAGKLIISIAAGITTKYIEDVLGAAAVIRAMPNIGAFAGSSLTYVCKGQMAKDSDIKFALSLFRCVGQVFEFPEEMMDAATAVGGSGPGFWGYLFDRQPRDKWEEYRKNDFIPEFIIAAKSVGFLDEQARLAANFVVISSVRAIKALNITPVELTKRVASKAGTTEAGLEVLKSGGTLTQAVQAARKRAHELSGRA